MNSPSPLIGNASCLCHTYLPRFPPEAWSRNLIPYLLPWSLGAFRLPACLLPRRFGPCQVFLYKADGVDATTLSCHVDDFMHTAFLWVSFFSSVWFPAASRQIILMIMPLPSSPHTNTTSPNAGERQLVGSAPSIYSGHALSGLSNARPFASMSVVDTTSTFSISWFPSPPTELFSFMAQCHSAYLLYVFIAYRHEYRVSIATKHVVIQVS